jgi:tetrahydromethanopterin S-methyltransferase subunit A
LSKIKTLKSVDDLAGKICRIMIPVKQDYFPGEGKSLAICTLSSLDLLEQLSRLPFVMERVAMLGRLLSENKGIDSIVKFAVEHPDLERIILCGREVKGHRAGQALLSLSKNGIDFDGRIIGALGPYPTLHASRELVDLFRKQVRLVDLIGTTDAERIMKLVT